MMRIFLSLLAISLLVSCTSSEKPKEVVPDADNAGLKLPTGFTATTVADSLGTARHIAVNSNGDIFVKLGSPKEGKGILVLTDADGDGRAEKRAGFGDFGGTGIAIKNGYLYASSNSGVYRYKLNDKGLVDDGTKADTIVKNLIDREQHNSKSIALDDNDNLYVNIGAYSNACQDMDRKEGAKGMMPCPILDSAGGIWQFSASKINQSYAEGIRFATGLRNVVGLDWNTQNNHLFVMQHGRDQLHDLFPDLYDVKMNAELPSEAMYMLNKGDDAGWPYIYYDHLQKKKILQPEYGGDGKKEGGQNAIDPVVAFPGHLAPNALLFYTGSLFPAKYKNGAFIAFHGSWNRAPEKQEGYYVAFVPFTDGKPSGQWEIFADHFAGAQGVAADGSARHRPCGLAQGPDGSLYVSDDAIGRIYRIGYKK